MLYLKKTPYNSYCVSADSTTELATAFLRFQEHYESPSKDFKGKIFTQGQLRRWYSETYGSNSYHLHWIGFNIPSKILSPFKDGLFDPLTTEEQRLIELFRYRNDDFYIIGAQNKSTLRHELCHAMYGYSPKYKLEIDNFIQKNNQKFKKVSKYILDKGYTKGVVNDELQAYITDNDDTFILNNLDAQCIAGINKIYQRYKKHDLN